MTLAVRMVGQLLISVPKLDRQVQARVIDRFRNNNQTSSGRILLSSKKLCVEYRCREAGNSG